MSRVLRHQKRDFNNFAHIFEVMEVGGASVDNSHSLRKPEIDITAAKPEADTYRAIGELHNKFRRVFPHFRATATHGDKICARPWKRLRVQIGIPVRGPVSVSVPMPVIVFVERLRVCDRGHVPVTVSVNVSVHTSKCPCPVRVYGYGSVLIVFLSWTCVRVHVRGHVLW